MADSNIIKSFLVSIGYKHDEVALKKIQTGIESATKSVMVFGAALTAVATTVAWGVTRIAGNLEDLYFAAKKTGESARSLQAFEIAMQRVGVTAGGGMGAVKALVSYFRSMGPGIGASMLRTRFGVDINESDPVKALMDIGGAINKRGMSWQQANVLAPFLNEDQIWGLKQQAQLRSQYAEQFKLLGPNFENATKKANEFKQALQDVETALTGLGVVVLEELEKDFGKSLKDLLVWMQSKEGREAAKHFADNLHDIYVWLDTKIIPKIEWLIQKLFELDKATNGWSTTLLGLAVLLGLGNTIGLIAAVVSLGTAFGGVALAIGAAVGAYELWEHYGKTTEAKARAADIKTILRKGSLFGNLFGAHEGFNEQQAFGIVAGLGGENDTYDPNRVESGGGEGYGLTQMGAAKRAQFQAWLDKQGMGHKVFGSSAREQTEFLRWDLSPQGTEKLAGALLQSATNWQQAMDIFVRYYERPKDWAKEEARIMIQQEAHFNIEGSGVPEDVVRRVNAAQTQIMRETANKIIREAAIGGARR